MATETDAARDRVLAARAALGDELEALEASARAAVDIPAKIRRSPAKAAAIAGGAGLPRARRPEAPVPGGAGGRSSGAPEPLPKSMLPEEVEKTLRKLGRRRRQGPWRARTRLRRLRQAGAAGTREAADAADPRRSPGRFLSPGHEAGGRLAVPHRRRGLPGAARRDPGARRKRAAWRSRRARCRRRRRAVDGHARQARLSAGAPAAARARAALDFAAGEWRNGRRAGLRSRCRVSGVEVRSLSRLPRSARRRGIAAQMPATAVWPRSSGSASAVRAPDQRYRGERTVARCSWRDRGWPYHARPTLEYHDTADPWTTSAACWLAIASSTVRRKRRSRSMRPPRAHHRRGDAAEMHVEP